MKTSTAAAPIPVFLTFIYSDNPQMNIQIIRDP